MGGIQSMARELGVSEDQVRTGAEALLPAILGGFKKQAQTQPAGLDGLVGMLGGLGGTGLMEEVLAPRATDVSRGNDVLGQIFGSRDVSRTVTQNAASKTGLDPALLAKMLPMVVMLVSGIMAKQGGPAAAGAPSGGIGDILGGLFGGGSQASAQPGAAGLASMLDLDRDGNPLDDIIGMAGKLLG
jgi:hypothetical protein